MPDFQINPLTCLLEVNCGTDEAPNWQPVYTPAYEPNTDAPAPPTLYPDPPPPGQSNACLAAANLTAMLQNGANNIRALLVDGAAFGAVLQNIFTFLSQVVTLIQAQLWPDFQVAYGTWNAATIQADYDAFDWEALQCIIYENMDEDGQWSGDLIVEQIASFNNALNEAQSNIPESQIWSIVSFAMSAMGWIGTNLATRWGGITSADCSCPDCDGVQEFDFAACGACGFAFTTGSTTTGGLHGADVGGGVFWLNINRSGVPVASGSTVKSITAHVDYPDNFGESPDRFEVMAGASGLVNVGTITLTGDGEYTITPDPGEIIGGETILHFGFITYGGRRPVITKLEFCYDGVEPY